MTPHELLPTIFLKGNVELEENVYRGNISATTNETALSFGISLEVTKNREKRIVLIYLSHIPTYEIIYK